ncbi:MAG: NAD(P)-dependent alcohol dehydrogenase [Gammaproteobacteria bacterium]
MRTVVLDEFGSADVLKLREVPEPTPGEGQVKIQVHATNINPIDWKMREGQMAARYGDEFPMILGWDCSGVVVELGDKVTEFALGDEVFARSDVGTGRCYAEYAVLNVATVVKKPRELSHLEAGSIPLVGLTALNGLINCANLRSGQRVLIIGASGGVGTLAVQIAKNIGAHVTAVCSAANMELVASLGADAVIDYNVDDPLMTNTLFDLVYDTVGVRSCEEARAALTGTGTYLTLVPVQGIDFFIPGQTEWEPGKGYFVAWAPTASDLQVLADWAAAGKLRAVIDSEFSLEEIKQAHLRSETERAVGKIVIRVLSGQRV